MNSYPKTGTVSHATMRPQDLIPAFLEALKTPTDVTTFNDWVCRLHDDGLIKTFSYQSFSSVLVIDEWVDDDSSVWHAEYADDTLAEIMDALDDIAPPYCYFGAHEGDGSDYGFWPSVESVEAAVQDSELESGDELPEHYPEGGLFAVVSDHGNVTLYQAKPVEFDEVWAVV